MTLLQMMLKLPLGVWLAEGSDVSCGEVVERVMDRFGVNLRAALEWFRLPTPPKAIH